MKALVIRVQNLLFPFPAKHIVGTSKKYPYTLDYEYGVYRQDELVKIIRDAVPHFALTKDEIEELKTSDKTSDLNRVSWGRISKARKDKKGDFGEIFLFLILSVFFPTQKFVTKVRLKSSRKEQVKGFDCAHFTIENGSVYLWLGEAKFHKTFTTAVTSAFTSINDHCNREYISDEISILSPNIELQKGTDDYEKLLSVVTGGVSLDRINIRVPVLLTYDSTLISKYSDINDQLFIENIGKELRSHFAKIDKTECVLHSNIELLFIIIPFESIDYIKEKLDQIEKALV